MHISTSVSMPVPRSPQQHQHRHHQPPDGERGCGRVLQHVPRAPHPHALPRAQTITEVLGKARDTASLPARSAGQCLSTWGAAEGSWPRASRGSRHLSPSHICSARASGSPGAAAATLSITLTASCSTSTAFSLLTHKRAPYKRY